VLRLFFDHLRVLQRRHPHPTALERNRLESLANARGAADAFGSVATFRTRRRRDATARPRLRFIWRRRGFAPLLTRLSVASVPVDRRDIESEDAKGSGPHAREPSQVGASATPRPDQPLPRGAGQA